MSRAYLLAACLAAACELPPERSADGSAGADAGSPVDGGPGARPIVVLLIGDGMGPALLAVGSCRPSPPRHAPFAAQIEGEPIVDDPLAAIGDALRRIEDRLGAIELDRERHGDGAAGGGGRGDGARNGDGEAGGDEGKS